MGDSYRLKWNNHQENLTGIMTKLLDEKKFVDVSIVCETKTFKAHQTVLSASSPYFEQVLEENLHPHPIIILKDVKEREMTALLQYMYRGEVSVRDEELPGFLHLARELKVRGLSENKKEVTPLPQESTSPSAQVETVTPPKRLRTCARTNEQETLDVQSPTGISNSKPTSNPPVPPVISSENSSDMHYSSASTPSQTIKQEFDSLVPSEESHLANLETRSELSHRLGDWTLDYGHSTENRNYSNQKTNPVTYLASEASTSQFESHSTPSTSHSFDGSKQWSLKDAFRKIEGSGFLCKICGQIKKHPRNHFLKHFPEHHVCPICRRTYTRKDNLNSHLKKDHSQRSLLKCELRTPPDTFQGLTWYNPYLYNSMRYFSSLHTPSLYPQPSTGTRTSLPPHPSPGSYLPHLFFPPDPTTRPPAPHLSILHEPSSRPEPQMPMLPQPTTKPSVSLTSVTPDSSVRSSEPQSVLPSGPIDLSLKRH